MSRMTETVVIAMLTAASLVARSDEAQQKTLHVVTSFYPMYIAALNIAKDIPGVEVKNLTKPQTGCLHDYQLTAEDMINASKADVLVVNGAGMESFLDKVIKQSSKTRIIQASEGIELLKGEDGNPHVWVSVSLHIKQIANIVEGLAKFDPSHAVQYRKNAADYVARLEELRSKMRDGLKDVKTRDIITFHEAFPYFAKEFGLNIVAVIEREPGSEPSAAELADVVKTVKERKVKTLFTEPQYPSKAAETIAKETGGTVYMLDPVVTGPDAPDAYIKIMEGNLDTLKKALYK